jgi:hypothetical protein
MPALATSKRRAVLAALGLAVVATTGCAGDRPSTLPTITTYYDPTLVWHATRGGFQTVVVGNPFAAAPADAAQRIVDSLVLPPRFERARFVVRDAAQPIPGYRLVLVFDPLPPGLRFQDACGEPAKIGVAPRADVVVMHAAFCVGSRSITEYTTVGARPADPGDPMFRLFLNRTIEELLPNYAPRQPGFSAR